MSPQPSVTAVLRATCSTLLCHHSFTKYHLPRHHDPDALPILLQSLLSLPHWPSSLPPKSLRIVDGPCHSWIIFSSLSRWFYQSSSIKYASTIKLMSWCSFPPQKKSPTLLWFPTLVFTAIHQGLVLEVQRPPMTLTSLCFPHVTGKQASTVLKKKRKEKKDIQENIGKKLILLDD